MGSRLHGNDGERRWVPVSTGTTVGSRRRHLWHTSSSFPRRRESTAGEAAMGSRLHGNDGERRRTYVVIPAQAGIHGGGSGDGFPSPRERRWAAAHLCRHSRAGGNPRRGKRRWVPVSTGTTVSGGTPMSSFPRRRESTAGEAAMGSRLHGNDGERRHTYVVIPAQAGIHGGEAAMGSRLAGTTVGGGAPTGGNPRRGSGDGFPSPRERR